MKFGRTTREDDDDDDDNDEGEIDLTTFDRREMLPPEFDRRKG
jgi:hypothetical protein